jgi:hypothetical protein
MQTLDGLTVSAYFSEEDINSVALSTAVLNTTKVVTFTTNSKAWTFSVSMPSAAVRSGKRFVSDAQSGA